MSWRAWIMFVLAGAFLVLAPLSVTSGTSQENIAKMLRVVVTVLMVLTGAVAIHQFRPGAATISLMLFVAFFVAAALWSNSPQWGLFHKGMFGLSCMSGVFLAMAPRDLEEFKKGIRFLGLVASAVTLLVVAVYLQGGGAEIRQDRLSILGANANTVGGVAASLLILCVYLMLHAKSITMKCLLLMECAVLAAVILGSGSRGGLLVSLIGCVMLALPFVKRPMPLIVAGLILSAAVFFVMEFVELPGVSRLGEEMGKDTRSNIWKFAMRKFRSSPLFGVGWLNSGTGWSTVQSAYLQTLVETGVIGASLLAGWLFIMLFRMKQLAKWAISRGPVSDAASIVLAMLASILFHGLAESTTFVGTSIDSLLLGFGVGMSDRMPELAAKAKPRRSNQKRYILVPVGPPPPERAGRQPSRSA
jgi:O-antigen ligase